MDCKSIDLRIARVAKENLEPKESAVVEDVDDNRGNPRVMAKLAEPYSDTYAIVNNNGDAITADEIESQANIRIPPTSEEFIFEGYC
jgi:short-subunit dehydrogenase involved in D-alanine esterification of teichoic acids